MAPRTGTIQVELEGRGSLTLRESDYQATGGEASIYRAHATIVKLYTDPDKMRRDGMEEKITLLRPLKSPTVMAPEGIVRDKKGTPIGLYMSFAEGEPLPRLFTNAFRQRQSFSDTQAATLVDRMRETVRFAHAHNAVMADANELNWIADLTNSAHPESRAIDVDSWAIGRFGASVVMPSIRDWHMNGFTRESDWFAWAVVTFQLFAGIHPYRGVLDGYGRDEFEKRMKNNASVFSPNVRLNAAVRDFNTIPQRLREWYEAVFQKGERTIPPSPFDKGVGNVAPQAHVLRATVTPGGSLIFEKLFEMSTDPVVRVWPSGVVLLASGRVFDLKYKRQVGTLLSRNAEVVKVEEGWLLADWVAGQPVFTFVDERSRTATALPLLQKGNQLMRYENRLFLVTDMELLELGLMQVGRPLLSVVRRTSILAPRATKWFDGVGIEEAFGAAFALLPFGEKSSVTLRIRELDQLVPVAAKAGNRFVSIVGLDRLGSYYRVDLTFTADYSSYVAVRERVDDSNLNLTILPKGVCAAIANDGELDIFVPQNGTRTQVKNQHVRADMLLSHVEDSVVYTDNGALWRLKMK